jgi:hypothetical protein
MAALSLIRLGGRTDAQRRDRGFMDLFMWQLGGKAFHLVPAML